MLGFLNAEGDELHTFSKDGSVKADFVIASINQWRASLTKPTVLVLDNRTGEPARIHHSQLLKACLAGWEDENLYIFFLPTYSPHLNRIERLWLKAKQRWLKPRDYADLASLKAALDTIWAEFGQKYRVNFS